MKLLNKSLFLKVIFIFIILQPFYDSLLYLLNKSFGINSIIFSFIRPLMGLFIYMWLLFSKNINKKSKIISFLVLFIYAAYSFLHLVNVKDYFFIKSSGTIVEELRYLIVGGYYLLMLINFYFVFKIIDLKEKQKLIKTFIIAILIMTVLYFIAIISGTSPQTYYNSTLKHGWKGWSISNHYVGHSILLSFPIIIYFCLIKQLFNKFLNYIIPVLVLIPPFFTIGTKAPMYSILGYMIMLCIIVIIETFMQKKIKKNYIFIILLTCGLLISFPHTFAYNNTVIQIDNSSNSDKKIDFINNPINDSSFDDIYENFNNYGNKILFILNNNQNISSNVFDNRQIQLKLNKDFYEISSINDKLFGYGYISMPKNTWVETDSISIFYSFGLIAFILLIFLPYSIISYSGLKALLNIKKMSNDKWFFGFSFGLSFILITFVGYTLFFAQTNFYLIILLNICLMSFKDELNN